MKIIGVCGTTRIATMAAFAILQAGLSSLALGQAVQISRFVSPEYPPLARQAMISGQVTLNVELERFGTVAGFAGDPSGHPLLVEWVKSLPSGVEVSNGGQGKQDSSCL